MYNAIIRDFRHHNHSNGLFGVTGRVHLRDLRQVPASWRITYQGNALQHTSDLNELLCSAEEPIQLYRPLLPVDNGTTIFIQCQSEQFYELPVSLDDTVESVKAKLLYLTEIPVDSQRLIFNDKTLSDNLILRDCNVEGQDVLELVIRLRGGSNVADFSIINLEGMQRGGRSEGPAKYPWAGYKIGLNLYGECSNESCISKRENGESRDLVVHAKYGIVRMTGSRNKFRCPACKSVKEDGRGTRNSNRDIGVFTPQNFLLSYGRSLFRFKKSGLDQPVKRIMMESLGPSNNYMEIDESKGESAEYDFIEITTVGKDSSPFICIGCDRRCGKSEIVLECGHAYHRGCRPMNEDGCMVCTSEHFGNMMEVLEMIEDGARSAKRMKTDVSDSDLGVKESVNLSDAAYMKIDEAEYRNNLCRMMMRNIPNN